MKNITKILRDSPNTESARNSLIEYLKKLEEDYFGDKTNKAHILERMNAKECIKVLRNIIRRENELLTGFSALEKLIKLFKGKGLEEVSKGFICEFIFLFKGINCNSGIFIYGEQNFNEKGRKAAIKRSQALDKYSSLITKYFKRYKTGCDPDIVRKTNELKKEILQFFGGKEEDWLDYKWHMKNIIMDLDTLSSLIKLEKDEIESLKYAQENNIPFQITPHYLSLFNKNGRCDYDRVLRAQVIPSLYYCKNVVKNREEKISMDFMGEHSTSPIDCITRRYPQILILKPYDACPQICVYCQRNWEVKSIKSARITKKKVEKAISWIKENKNITEVLVTGGDPFSLSNEYIDWLMGELAKIEHVERIRIGTRTLVTLPYRINEGMIKILKKCHKLGKREVCIVTHFEHPIEICPPVLEAIKKIKELGISIYNQQVFTYYNSRKFETCFLRRTLKLYGIDPYYAFNTKGKEETMDFRVPIARIEQERKEEARLLPGVVRTDEPVFNVPKLGKSHLRAWQDHEVIMILADGKRVYRFLPWESKFAIVDDYLYTDVSIYDYLKRLDRDGENIEDYKSIWYYF